MCIVGEGRRVKEKQIKESTLVTNIVRELKKRYGDAVCVEKRHGTPYGKIGQPDLSICIDGRRVELEAKVGRNKPTAMQWERLAEWARAGAVVGVVYSVEDALRIVEQAREKL